MKKRIIMVTWIFFVCTGAILFLIHLIMSKYEIPDPPNYVTIIVEVAVGFFIAALVYMITKKQQSDTEKREKAKETEEHQHFKERLLDELSTLVFRVDLAMSQFGKEEQKPHMFANLNDAKVNLNGLRQINSIFSVPTKIRSQCDDLLSYYHIMIESTIQGHLFEKRIISGRNDLTEHVKAFIENEFFSKENNEIIDKKITKLNDQLNQIRSKTK